jgi:hypothetical protein
MERGALGRIVAGTNLFLAAGFNAASDAARVARARDSASAYFAWFAPSVSMAVRK